MSSDDALQAIIAMTQMLGQPERDYVIVGEGNTSYRIDDDMFWVKASGKEMHGIEADGFIAMRIAPILDLFQNPAIDADALREATSAAKVDAALSIRPSIEVMFHAALLADCGVRCIAHTHPTAVNGILCSTRAETFAYQRMFPDQIVICGPRSVYLPYIDPGMPLAIALRDSVRDYLNHYGEPPKTILMQNHGLIALGTSAADALSITAMSVKAARIFSGACAAGDPVFLSDAEIAHIYQRPDEIYRRKLWADR